jgi:hypothetical protein
MDLKTCQSLLVKQYQNDLSQNQNISKLTNVARWQNKAECVNALWWLNNIKTFLDEPGLNNYIIEDDTTTAEIENTVAKTESSSFDSFMDKLFNKTSTKTTGAVVENNNIQQTQQTQSSTVEHTFSDYKSDAINIFLIFIFLILLFKFLRAWLKYLYSFLSYRRFVFLKVTLPRWDDKSDREQDKELAKDMKEKIWRMSQVYNNLHKISELSTWDTIMWKIFAKQKLVFIYHYENGFLNFIVWTFPEYKQVVESSISAQYSNCSIEQTSKPKFFSKKYNDITVLKEKRDPVYTIRLFKLLPDDPINNIIDSMSKISPYDTVSIVMPIKPEWSWFNEKMKLASDRLYKNLWLLSWKDKRWAKFLMPWKLFDFIISGPSKEMGSNKKQEDNITMVRMVKWKEDSINSIWEEAARPIFKAGLYIATSSDEKENLEKNMDSIMSSYNVYGDEYGNELNEESTKHDIFGSIAKPLWKLWISTFLTWFFTKYHYYSVNALSSLFHFPDGTYNRSPVIEWMQYKILSGPNNLPVLEEKDFNGFVMSGILAEKYKDWNLSEILKEYGKHWAVWKKVVSEEVLVDINTPGLKDIKPEEIIEKDWKKYVKQIKQKETLWYKLYKSWVLLWVNIYRNTLSPVYIKREDRTRHYYCIWKSGTWKSVFLQTLARQDVWNGDWICLIDPHGDLAEDILAYIPKERAKDVIYFDAGDEERPMGLNLYEISNLDEADRVVNDATEIFLKMFGPEIFWPRLQEYFKYGSLTLLEDFEDRPTLLDVVRLFTDEAYREYKLKKVTNPTVRNRWEKTFNAMWDREKQEIIPYLSAKFVSFNTNRLIRNIIWQTKSAFRFEEVMDNRKILIINLSKWKIWELNAQLLWMIIVSKIYTAAMARARMEEKDRKDFYLYVDEFQNFVSGTFADILSEARKYRLCLIMAHQYIAQLEPAKWLGGDGWGKWDVKAAVFGNVWTMQSFKIWAPDAEFLEKEYAPVLSPSDIVWIANYKAYVKLNIDNSTTRVFSMNTIYTKDYQNKKVVPILKEYSAKKYGRKREFVDAEMSARLGINTDEEQLPTNGNAINTTENTTPTEQADNKVQTT